MTIFPMYHFPGTNDKVHEYAVEKLNDVKGEKSKFENV